MEMNKINFDSMESNRKKCITFAKDGNKVVKPYKTVYCLEQITQNPKHKNIFLELVPGSYNNSIRIWDCLGSFCISIGDVRGDTKIEDISQMLENYPYLGVEGYLCCLRMKKERGDYINRCDIETCNMLGKDDLALEYEKYRDALIERIHLKEKEEAKRREELRTQREAEEREKREDVIQNAENMIKTRQSLKNDKFESGTIILYLMKKYEVNVPLKTQGWINKALAEIFFQEDGTIWYKYYKKSRDSGVFWKYLARLEEKIRKTI